jgi:hypothetical protein
LYSDRRFPPVHGQHLAERYAATDYAGEEHNTVAIADWRSEPVD